MEKIFIPNRGEIAVRVIRTAKRMGFVTAVGYSERDRYASHTLKADEGYEIGSSAPRESYLHIERILHSAKKARANLLHPGYGFLAENALFAQKVIEEGILWIGPPPSALALMGNKLASKKLAQKAGVPVILGTEKGIKNLKEAEREVKKIGFPVMLKASMGGGGKGMRLVRNMKELREFFSLASQEAKNAFGDPTLYIEKFIKDPKHIEFQVIADKYGNVVHLFERECSIQRRHQKLIEESPALILDSKKRKEMGECACEIIKEAGYQNAGTVEFLYDKDGKFYFMEVNARLQVEHPVTEMRTGIDLIEEQIRITMGEKLRFKQEDIKPRGASIEVRIYAEDPENKFFPTPGPVQFLLEPQGPFVRVDSGIYTGYEIPMEYDPLLMKVITWGEKREEAIDRMRVSLQELWILGPVTTRDWTLEILSDHKFREGKHTVNFIEGFIPAYSSDSKSPALGVASFYVLSQEKKRTIFKRNLPEVKSRWKENFWFNPFYEL